MRFRQNTGGVLITVRHIIETPVQFLNHKKNYKDNKHVYKIKETPGADLANTLK